LLQTAEPVALFVPAGNIRLARGGPPLQQWNCQEACVTERVLRQDPL